MEMTGFTAQNDELCENGNDNEMFYVRYRSTHSLIKGSVSEHTELSSVTGARWRIRAYPELLLRTAVAKTVWAPTK